jgi:DNA modification methylase
MPPSLWGVLCGGIDMDKMDYIICGDSLDVMRKMPDNYVDMVLTDPPYGVKRDKGFGGFGGFGVPIARRQYETDSWDENRPPPVYFEEILRVGKQAIISGGNYFADMLPQGAHWLFWDKLSTMPTFGDGELFWTNIDRKSVKKYTRQWNGLLGKEKERYHPTQKPLNLMMDIIGDYTKEGDIIFDPFMGSGTTILGAKLLNREYIGVERLEKYCRIAKSRLDRADQEPRLF